ncbi:hypothetical protein LCER1_G004126 [Lachnellula cervina]|uniref:Uncharacterized protein n=1 Tax=Lachnellula cervina TaxID=1316786 RepID=A0A7D8UU97_9HELO|nr:hypothetical protein LCER1_G004126 [Lachnellula cervina]
MAKRKKNNSAGGSGPAPSQDLNPAAPALTLRPKKPRRNIVKEFDRYFGSEDDLENWQRLCHDVGVDDDLSSITKCRKMEQALKGIWVNIYDFLDAVEKDEQPRRFPSQNALARYTIENDKIYPKKAAKEEGPVRALLAHIFNRGGSGRRG